MDYWIDRDKVFYPTSKLRLPLIHITQNWDTLELILKEGFRPSYCTEFITNDSKMKSAAFPMVSLSNMTVENAVQSQKSYGTLGIALDQTWGQENDFNPVLYLERKSDLTNEIIECFQNIKAATPEELIDIIGGVGVGHGHVLTRTILKVFAHSKNYDGQLVRDGTLYDKAYPFGLEREWRKIVIHINAPYFLIGDDSKRKKEFNQQFADVRIDFDLKYIKCVIVESEWQQQAVEELLIKKYNVASLPKELKIYLNATRHVPDEG